MTDDLSCYREWDDDGWFCVHDHTACMWNDGNNTCTHEGESINPLRADSILEEWSKSYRIAPFIHITTRFNDPDLLQKIIDGEVDVSECEHQDFEDHMFCAICHKCREDLDENDICPDCGGSVD